MPFQSSLSLASIPGLSSTHKYRANRSGTLLPPPTQASIQSTQVKFELDEFFERQGMRDGPDIAMELVGSFTASNGGKLKRKVGDKEVPYVAGFDVRIFCA